MAKIFYRSHEDRIDDDGAPVDSEVNEQHPLPIQIAWRSEGSREWQLVDEGAPLPTSVSGLVSVKDALWFVEVEIPGIADADAFDANDAVGTVFWFPAPRIGRLINFKLIDPDDDTLALTAHIFNRLFTGAASDAAFTISAADSRAWVTSATFSAVVDIGGAKVSEVVGDSFFRAPEERLYFQCSTSGTPNIAAGRKPILQVGILVGAEA